jgi:hypothetical protein
MQRRDEHAGGIETEEQLAFRAKWTYFFVNFEVISKLGNDGLREGFM